MSSRFQLSMCPSAQCVAIRAVEETFVQSLRCRSLASVARNPDAPSVGDRYTSFGADP